MYGGRVLNFSGYETGCGSRVKADTAQQGKPAHPFALSAAAHLPCTYPIVKAIARCTKKKHKDGKPQEKIFMKQCASTDVLPTYY